MIWGSRNWPIPSRLSSPASAGLTSVSSGPASTSLFSARSSPSAVTSLSSTGPVSKRNQISRRFRMPTSPIQMFGQPDSHAKTSASQEWARDLGLEGKNLDSFMSLLDWFQGHFPELLSSKTCTASSLATEDVTSESYSRRWTSSGMVSHGVFLTANTSESPNNAVGASLLECIETQEVPERYFLSPNAATGILRRADQMGRNLLPSFRSSLEILSKGR